MDVVLAKDFLDGLDPRLDRRLVIGGAVLAEQELQDVGRDNCIALYRLDQVLANHEAREAFVDLVIQRGHRFPRQKSKSLEKLRRSV